MHEYSFTKKNKRAIFHLWKAQKDEATKLIGKIFKDSRYRQKETILFGSYSGDQQSFNEMKVIIKLYKKYKPRAIAIWLPEGKMIEIGVIANEQFKKHKINGKIFVSFDAMIQWVNSIDDKD